MASNFTLNSGSYEGRYLQLYCVQEKDIANNRSKITWQLSSLGGSSNYYSVGATSVNIDGNQVYYCERKSWDSKEFPASKGSVIGTIYVDHDVKGDKSVPISLTTAIYVGAASTYDGTWTLDNIPREAKVTAAPSNFLSNGEPPTISYTNPAGNNVTSLDICIADDRAYNAYAPYRPLEKGLTSYQFTANDMEALKSIAGSTLNLTFVIRTIINNTILYNAYPSVFVMVEDDTTKPTVRTDATLNNGSLPSAFNGLYIQGKSRIDVKLSASGKCDAYISNYYATLDGKTYYGDEFTSEPIQTSGDNLLIGYAKDSRGFTGSDSKTINVIPYSKPLVIPIGSENAILCYRSDGNGKRVGNSTSVWIKAKRDYRTVTSNGQQKNFCALQWRKKLSSDAWDDNNHQWEDLIPKTDTATSEYNTLLPDEVFELTKSYTFQIRAIDDIGEKDVKTFEIPTQDVALHLGKGGKNVSVGTYCDYSEDYTFYSEWKAIFDKGFIDGSDTGWITIKEDKNSSILYRAKCGYVTIIGMSHGDILLTQDVYTIVGVVPKPYAPSKTVPIVFHTVGGSPIAQSGFVDGGELAGTSAGDIRLYTNVGGISYWAFSVTYPL